MEEWTARCSGQRREPKARTHDKSSPHLNRGSDGRYGRHLTRRRFGEPAVERVWRSGSGESGDSRLGAAGRGLGWWRRRWQRLQRRLERRLQWQLIGIISIWRIRWWDWICSGRCGARGRQGHAQKLCQRGFGLTSRRRWDIRRRLEHVSSFIDRKGEWRGCRGFGHVGTVGGGSALHPARVRGTGVHGRPHQAAGADNRGRRTPTAKGRGPRTRVSQ